jgi:heat-inducible transcriptional repressor
MQNRVLNERESSILIAVVFEYITTGKPVGSRSFGNKYSLSISPATIRNVMSDLEAMGYLTQPHTSAGRIPTDKGYRFYVDSLLDSYDSVKTDKINFKEDLLKEELMKRELHLDRMFSSITRMLSITSKYAGVVLSPIPDYTVVKHIELVPLGNNNILFVLITRMGMVLNRKIAISASIDYNDLFRYSKYLTGELCGFSLFDIKGEILKNLRSNKLITGIEELSLDIAELALTKSDEPGLFIEGIENLLHIPEMVESERLNALLRLFEEKRIIKGIMENNIDIDGVHSLIGEEIDGKEITGCSIVFSSYKIGSKNVGSLGILGPTRMDYEKVVPLVDYTGKMVSNFLTEMAK